MQLWEVPAWGHSAAVAAAAGTHSASDIPRISWDPLPLLHLPEEGKQLYIFHFNHKPYETSSPSESQFQQGGDFILG